MVIGSFSEGNNVYTDVKEPERKNEKEPYKEQENENPLYEAADVDSAVLKPIYDRFVKCSCCDSIDRTSIQPTEGCILPCNNHEVKFQSVI